ncbi:MAG: hypothetical protein Q9161_004178 [Pseudevernia consocians]
MATQPQSDEVIATYQIFPSDQIIGPAASSICDEESIFTGLNTSRSSMLHEPTWSFTGVVPSEDEARKNLITLFKSTKVKPYTHVAHVVLGTWGADFLCKYDEPAGMLHNAKVKDMNEDMQKATGWSRQDAGKHLTWEEKIEEKRADIKFGVFKKPRSEKVGLCTLKQTDDAGWRFLELRTRGVNVGGGECGKDGEKSMISSVAKRLIGGVRSTLLSAAESERLKEDDAGKEEGKEERKEDEDETIG